MGLLKQIRREHTCSVGTIQGVAKKLGVHWRTVREALADAVPRERKSAIRPKPRLEAVRSFTEAILEADQSAPRKRRRTAHRIWCRIRTEMPEVNVAERPIRLGAEDSIAIGRPDTVTDTNGLEQANAKEPMLQQGIR